MGKLIEGWQNFGFHTHDEQDGEPVKWVDVCVVEFFRATLPCDWIDFNEDGAFLKGHTAGELVNRDNFPDEQAAAMVAAQQYMLNN